jgi:hypothetical protein
MIWSIWKSRNIRVRENKTKSYQQVCGHAVQFPTNKLCRKHSQPNLVRADGSAALPWKKSAIQG